MGEILSVGQSKSNFCYVFQDNFSFKKVKNMKQNIKYKFWIRLTFIYYGLFGLIILQQFYIHTSANSISAASEETTIFRVLKVLDFSIPSASKDAT